MPHTPSFAGFLEFIQSQPADRVVNNSSFTSCMVGDYAREVVDQPLPAADSDNYYYNVNKHDVLVALWKGCGVSYEWDNHEDYGTEKTDDPSFMDEVNEGFFGTYGEAQEYLKENA